MKLKVTIGCILCNHSTTSTVDLPFNCDELTCSRCGSENTLSITKVHEGASLFEYHEIQNRLQKIREVQAI